MDPATIEGNAIGLATQPVLYTDNEAADKLTHNYNGFPLARLPAPYVLCLSLSCPLSDAPPGYPLLVVFQGSTFLRCTLSAQFRRMPSPIPI